MSLRWNVKDIWYQVGDFSMGVILVVTFSDYLYKYV